MTEPHTVYRLWFAQRLTLLSNITKESWGPGGIQCIILTARSISSSSFTKTISRCSSLSCRQWWRRPLRSLETNVSWWVGRNCAPTIARRPTLPHTVQLLSKRNPISTMRSGSSLIAILRSMSTLDQSPIFDSDFKVKIDKPNAISTTMTTDQCENVTQSDHDPIVETISQED